MSTPYTRDISTPQAAVTGKYIGQENRTSKEALKRPRIDLMILRPIQMPSLASLLTYYIGANGDQRSHHNNISTGMKGCHAVKICLLISACSHSKESRGRDSRSLVRNNSV